MGNRVPGGTWLAALVIVLAVSASYAGVVRNDFVQFDDPAYVTQNPHVLAGLGPGAVAESFRVTEHGIYFHPLTWLSLMLDVELFGPVPVPIHVENVALHALAAVLLLLALARATGRILPALLAALLFAVHPLTVEGVAWASERKAVLSGALGMAAILAYVALQRAGTWRRMAVVVAFLSASLLAKPVFVVLPALLLAMDVWPLGRIPLDRGPAEALRAARPAILEKLPLFAPILAILPPLVLSARFHEVEQHVTLAGRIANAVAAVPRYLVAFALPTGLSVFHPYPRDVDPWSVVIGVLAIAAITAGVAQAARRRPWWVFGWAWFLGAISPGLGLLISGRWPLWAERFAYVALIGPCVVAAFEAVDLASRFSRSSRSRTAMAAAAAIAVLALGAVTARQVGYWRSSVTLFERAVAVEPGSGLMQENLAIALDEAGRADEALVHHEAAVRIEPKDYVKRHGFGTALARAGRLDEAQAQLTEAVRLDPSSPDVHVQLGVVLQLRARRTDAEIQYRTALEIEPTNAEALYNLAYLLYQEKHYEESLATYRRFLDVAPARYVNERSSAAALIGQ
jgi:tetratricopeptide (TPR) repeat protein